MGGLESCRGCKVEWGGKVAEFSLIRDGSARYWGVKWDWEGEGLKSSM